MSGRHTHLYVYEGCSKHGCKVGIANKRSLEWRLRRCRGNCRQSTQFARVWELPNAFKVEQHVIGLLASSGRLAGPGEEWFHVECGEMIDAVEFVLEVMNPDQSQPRRYRTICGHILPA